MSPFCVEVHERLVGVRQHLDPAAVVEDLDPVSQVDVRVGEALVQHPHHRALERPRACTSRWMSVGAATAGDLRERQRLELNSDGERSRPAWPWQSSKSFRPITTSSTSARAVRPKRQAALKALDLRDRKVKELGVTFTPSRRPSRRTRGPRSMKSSGKDCPVRSKSTQPSFRSTPNEFCRRPPPSRRDSGQACCAIPKTSD